MGKPFCDYAQGCTVADHWVVRGDEYEQHFEHIAPTPIDLEMRSTDA
ncbi:hypothetical protein [Microbacterium lacus]|nr:hypothetical protein [Microbacterium lacus]